ncbi:MAG: FG-GAP-like repeat-containing protein, partial [Myxococcota bacterium]
MRKSLYIAFSTIAGIILSFGLAATTEDIAQAQCPTTTPTPASFTNGTLDSEIDYEDGIEYVGNAFAGDLRLERIAGSFQPSGTPPGTTLFPTTRVFVSAAAADFNGDGETDVIAAESTGNLVLFLNRSQSNLAAATDWNDLTYVLAPDFVESTTTFLPAPTYSNVMLAAADFDGDGDQDFVRLDANTLSPYGPGALTLFLNDGSVDGSGNPGFNFGLSALLPVSPPFFGTMNFRGKGQNMAVADFDGDRMLDLIIGSSTGGAGGSIHIFRNTCSPVSPLPAPPTQPQCSAPFFQFTYAGDMLTNMGLGAGSVVPSFAYEDFTGDGIRDLIAGANACCTAPDGLRMYKGSPFGGVTTTYENISFPGGAAFVLGTDISMDGAIDLVVGTDADSGYAGGQAFYYMNSRSPTRPFTTATTLLSATGAPEPDWNLGLAFNYDNDQDNGLPNNSPDLLFADDDDVTGFHLYSNRIDNKYVECGMVESKTLDLASLTPPLDTVDMQITAAKVKFGLVPNGGYIKNVWMTNEPIPVWQEASDCGASPTDYEYCVRFSGLMSGRDVRWRMDMCSDPTQTQTPEVDSVDVTLDYIPSDEFYRGGTVVHDGVVYIPGFSQPSQEGRLYAVDADFGTSHWEAGDQLQTMAATDRNIYTTVNGNDTSDFNTGGTDMNAFLFTPGATTRIGALSWKRGIAAPQWGFNPPTVLFGRFLGALLESTPAVVGRPGLPPWAAADTSEQTAITAFTTTYQSRMPIVMVGSLGGMLHAFRNDTTNISDSENGKEAWAFVPREVLYGMEYDFEANAGTSPDPPFEIDYYVDGSPTAA